MGSSKSKCVDKYTLFEPEKCDQVLEWRYENSSTSEIKIWTNDLSTFYADFDIKAGNAEAKASGVEIYETTYTGDSTDLSYALIFRNEDEYLFGVIYTFRYSYDWERALRVMTISAKTNNTEYASFVEIPETEMDSFFICERS